jgi:hypothetical protein
VVKLGPKEEKEGVMLGKWTGEAKHEVAPVQQAKEKDVAVHRNGGSALFFRTHP